MNDGRPEVGVGEELELARNDADDGGRFAVDDDLSSYQRRVASVPALPETLADDYRERTVGLFVGSAKGAAQDRINSEHAEERRRYMLDDDAPGSGLGLEDRIPFERDHRADFHEAFRTGLDVLEVRGGERVFRVVLRHVVRPDHREPVRIGIGERIQDDSVDHGEDRRVGTDAEGQGQDRQQCQTGPAGELANAIEKILAELIEVVGASHHQFLFVVDLPALPADVIRVAERPVRRPVCGIGRHALFGELAPAHFKMEVDLIVDVTAAVVSPEGQVSPPHRGFSGHVVYAQSGASFAFTTLPTASAKRAQVDISR